MDESQEKRDDTAEGSTRNEQLRERLPAREELRDEYHEEQLREKEEKEKMIVEGTRTSGVRRKEPAAPSPGRDPMAESEDSTAGPNRTIIAPHGVELIEEPRIASTGGKLVFEPRVVSTGGKVHYEIEPTSKTPPSPDEPPMAPSGENRGDPGLRGSAVDKPTDNPRNRGDLSGADLRSGVPTTGTSGPSGTGDPNVRPPTDMERHRQQNPQTTSTPETPARENREGGTPATLGSSSNPRTPGIPGNPGTVAVPAVPATPGTPGVPGTPGTAGTPAVSGTATEDRQTPAGDAAIQGKKS